MKRAKVFYFAQNIYFIATQMVYIIVTWYNSYVSVTFIYLRSYYMKKIINDPANVVPEMVKGMVRSYPQFISQVKDTEAVMRTDKDSMTGKVGIVSGGGSGHEPTHAGFVGKGMLSAAVCG